MKLKTLLGILVLAAFGAYGEDTIINVTSKGALAMALSSDKERAYIAGWSGQLDVVDLKKKALEQTVVLSPFSSELHVSAICQNDVFGVVVLAAGVVFVVNPTTLTVKSFNPKMSLASGCAFSNDGQLLYLTSDLRESSSEPKVSIVDSNLNITKLFQIGVPSVPHVTSSPVEDKLYLTIRNEATGEGWLGVIKGQELTRITKLSFFPGRITFSPDGKSAFIPALNSPNAGIALVNTATDEIVEFFGGFVGPWRGLVFSGNDPTFAYLDHLGGTQIWNLYKKDSPEWINTDSQIFRRQGALQIIRGETSDTLLILQTTDFTGGDSRLLIKEIKRPTPLSTPVITNAASFLVRPIVPGEIVSIFGEGLSTSVEGAMGFPLPTELGRTKVLVNNIAAPLFYVSPTQINFQVPFETPSGTFVDIVVTPDTARPDSQTTLKVTTTPSDVGVFSAEIEGAWRPIIINASRDPWELVSPSHPVLPGEWITLYLTGLGAVTPVVPTGQPAPFSPLSWTVDPVTVKINAQEVQIGFCGLAPGWAGLYQINVQVPANAQTGLQIMQVQVGRTASSSQYLLLPVGKQEV